jgi:hypothetical protein
MEGYLDVVREIASQYGSMSLIEFDDTLKENSNLSSIHE